MSPLPSLSRFFVVAAPVPGLMVGTFLVLIAVAALVLGVDPGRGAAAVTPVLALQLFAAAAGFSTPARRGHYDLLLTSGKRRILVVLAHWSVSIAPGMVAWLLVGLLEAAASGGRRGAVFTSGTIVAMALVSTLPWALSARLPRFAPSIGWLLVLVTIGAVAPPETVDRWLQSPSDGPQGAAAAAVFLLYPAVVIGKPLDQGGWVVVAPGLAAAATAMILACRWLARADFPLEASQ